MPRPSPFRYFKTSPEIIRLAVMLYIRFPLSLMNVDDLLHERVTLPPTFIQHQRDSVFEFCLFVRVGQRGLARSF